MRKIIKIFLIACGVIVAAYVIYFIVGRPPIPLPSVRKTVSQGNWLYDLVKENTESGKMTITWATNGEIEPWVDGYSLGKMNYDMDTLGNSAVIAARFLPEKTRTTLITISENFPPLRNFPKIVAEFFYYVIRFKINLNIYAK